MTTDMRAELTNFPSKGDNKAVSLRTSQWSLFPVGEAEALKKDWPEIWRKGGNIRGNKQFAVLAPIAKRGGKPDTVAEENAVRLREAWGARHGGDFQLAGVVAQVKWLVVGDRGLSHMRKVLREAKDKIKDRSDSPPHTPALAGEGENNLMSTTVSKPHKQYSVHATQLELRAGESLPVGICGRMAGVALVYGVIDSYGTTFLRGCLDRTRNERLTGGKIKLFADHMNLTSAHVGVVRTLEDIGDAVVMIADIFDTEDGRKMKEYLQAVMAATAETGLSVGFMPRRGAPSPSDPSVYEFQEVELREISITPMSAVPGTDVTGVRMMVGEPMMEEDDDEEDDAMSSDDLVEAALRAMIEVLDREAAARVMKKLYLELADAESFALDPVDMPSADAMSSDTADATDETSDNEIQMSDPDAATMDDRMRALRASYRATMSNDQTHTPT
jgi:HK97 family phage prohead protease